MLFHRIIYLKDLQNSKYPSEHFISCITQTWCDVSINIQFELYSDFYQWFLLWLMGWLCVRFKFQTWWGFPNYIIFIYFKFNSIMFKNSMISVKKNNSVWYIVLKCIENCFMSQNSIFPHKCIVWIWKWYIFVHY